MHTFLLSVAAAGAMCFVAATSADEWKNESSRTRERPEKWSDKWHDELGEPQGGHDRDESWNYPDHENRRSYFRERGYSQLKIPKGHYPAPGECRIWYPERPPGEQPPPGRCGVLRHEVPRDAWLIRHPADDPDHVHVIVYDERRRGAIDVVGEFEIATGMFVRVVVGR